MKRLTVLALSAVIAGSSAVVAHSAETRETHDDPASTLVRLITTRDTTNARDPRDAKQKPNASGTFEATGSGSVTLTGRQTSYGRIAGRLTVRVDKGTATVRIQGVQKKLKAKRSGSKRILTYSFRTKTPKTFYVRGNNVTLTLVSEKKRKLSVSTFGVARAKMKGVGTYRVNAARAKRWPRVTNRSTLPIRPVIGGLLPAELRP